MPKGTGYPSGHGGHEMQHGNSQNTTASAAHGGGGRVVATTLKPVFNKKPTAKKSRLTHGD